VSASKISKATAKKYQQLLENEKEYVVEKLLDVRECDGGDLEFLTKWEGYTKDHNTWEKLETFNGPLSEL
jgi:chromobox protein 5